MRHRPDLLILSAVLTLALCVAAPAEAASTGKKKSDQTAHATKHRRANLAAQPGFRDRSGVPAGPLYNGRDYLGTDPDPNIRSQILRDMGSRYGGND
jgi:hypothetical protein